MQHNHKHPDNVLLKERGEERGEGRHLLPGYSEGTSRGVHKTTVVKGTEQCFSLRDPKRTQHRDCRGDERKSCGNFLDS